jgi:integrase/recombinase XerD
MKLSTTLSHITTVPNSRNSKVISEFYQYMKDIETSENYQNLKAIIGYAKFLDLPLFSFRAAENILIFFFLSALT